MPRTQPKPPPFFCPACGQKHRADLAALRGRPGAVLKASCVRCRQPLAVSIDPQGGVRCLKRKPTEHAEAAHAVVEADTGSHDDAKHDDPKHDDAKHDGAAPSEPAHEPATSETPTASAAPAAQPSGEGAPPAAPAAIAEGAAPAAAAPASPPPAPPVPPARPAAKERETPSAAGSPASASRPVSSRQAAREKAHEKEKAAQEDKRLVDAEFAPGAMLERYRIEEAIGRGGTGTVYRVFDPTTNRTVALKVLLADLSDSMRQRFLREIEVQANIRHPNIMPVFDRGALPDGRPFFTMELLYKPFTLTEIVERRERGTLARYTTLKHFEELQGLISGVLVQVAEGVYLANVENGVIHRDLKPDNVLVDSRTLRPYVIDFGICHVLERDGKLSTGVVVPPTAEEAGIVGTPRYLSPEQARGSVHARTDVWGLGALVHFAITGEPPIAPASGITRSELQRRVAALRDARDTALGAGDDKKAALCDEKLGRLQADGLRTLDDLFRDARDGKYAALPKSTPTALAALIQKAMAPDPSARYVNGRQIAVELNAWVKGGRVRALAEAGGAGAAVDTAKRALRGKILPVVFLVVGLALGWILGGGVGGGTLRSDTNRLQLFEGQIGSYREALDTLARHSGTLMGPEAARLHSALDGWGAGIEKRLKQEPNDAARAAVLGQVAYQRNRLAKQRVKIAAPVGYAWTADQASERVLLKDGDDNLLTPGDWSIVGRVPEEGEVSGQKQLVERVRVPLRLPFVLREQGASPDRERPAGLVEVPFSPDQIPAGFVVVVGDRVPVRQAPYATPSLQSTAVATFLIGRAEVTNMEYAQYLASLNETDAATRTPAAGFVRDPSSKRPAVVRGLEEMPVVGVRPEDARSYAAWRGKVDGKSTRLPTEAEWLLAAGASFGYLLPGGKSGALTEAVFQPALARAGEHPEDVGPHGERGLMGNAREMVEPSEGEVPSGAVLVKGGGVGDTPDQAVLHLFRPLKSGDRHVSTGFRVARSISP